MTCRVPCGSFLQFSVALGFTLAAVPGLMDATTKHELEVVTWQHLVAFSRAKLDRQVAFEFDEVVLLSQAILNDIPRKQQGNLHLSLSLALRMQFQGFTIGVSRDDVLQLLLAGISSDAYQVALKELDEFFSEAVMSSLQQEASVLEPVKKDKQSTLPTIMISSLVAVLAALLGISLCMNPIRSGRWLPKLDILLRLEIDEHFNFTTPPPSCEIETPFPISYPGSPSSNDDSRASTFHAGNGVPSMRSIASQRFTVNVSSSSSNEEESNQKISSDNKDGSALVTSVDVPSQPEEMTEIEHALSKVIPPMIVFDDIDDNLGFPSNRPSDPRVPQVPGQLIKAPNDLISVLRHRKGNADPSIL